MAVTFEFIIEKGFHFGSAFGKRFGMPVSDNRVDLPASLGSGFIQEVFLQDGLSLCLHRYRLEQEFSLKRFESNGPTEMLTLKFDCRKVALEEHQHGTLLFAPGCEVQLGTNNFFTEVFFPVHQEIYFLVINIHRQVLVNLLSIDDQDPELQNSLLTNPSFVVNVLMSAEMEETLKQFSRITPGSPLSQLLYQAKTLEMIYQVFSKLTERAIDSSIIITRADADKLNEVRSIILNDLSVTPHLPELSKHIAMSPTKMKMLFRQVFGDTIYNYFQRARMNEAAKLLKDLSVSETAYSLGFTNLSHFSRLFEKYFKLKPKKFKDGRH